MAVVLYIFLISYSSCNWREKNCCFFNLKSFEFISEAILPKHRRSLDSIRNDVEKRSVNFDDLLPVVKTLIGGNSNLDPSTNLGCVCTLFADCGLNFIHH